MAKANLIENKTEAAYRRGDLFAKRRALMDAWASYLMSCPAYIDLSVERAQFG